jgi:hypothetical protein
MPTIDLTNGEHAAGTAAIKRAIDDDKFPSPRLDPLRSLWRSSIQPRRLRSGGR